MQFDDGDVDTGIEEWNMEMYCAKKLKVQALRKSSRKASVPVLDSAIEEKKQDVKKVENKVQVVLGVEAKQSVIVEEEQRLIKPKTISQFPLDYGISMCQIDLKYFGERTAWLNDNILAIGIKRIMSRVPEIFFVESIQFENVASLMVQQEGEFIIHGMERFRWVCKMRVSEVFVIAVNIIYYIG